MASLWQTAWQLAGAQTSMDRYERCARCIGCTQVSEHSQQQQQLCPLPCLAVFQSNHILLTTAPGWSSALPNHRPNCFLSQMARLIIKLLVICCASSTTVCLANLYLSVYICIYLSVSAWLANKRVHNITLCLCVHTYVSVSGRVFSPENAADNPPRTFPPEICIPNINY